MGSRLQDATPRASRSGTVGEELLAEDRLGVLQGLGGRRAEPEGALLLG